MNKQVSNNTSKRKLRKNDKVLLQRITINPRVLVGKPTIRGMRISVEQIINLLSQGMSHKEILDEYPILEEDDIRAALQYAYQMMSIEKVYKVASHI